jgi:hypothetical protein
MSRLFCYQPLLTSPHRFVRGNLYWKQFNRAVLRNSSLSLVDIEKEGRR